MIVSSVIAATLATQAATAPQPASAPAPAAEKKMACCEKMAKGEGCDCCKGMGKDAHAGHDMSKHDAPKQAQ